MKFYRKKVIALSVTAVFVLIIIVMVMILCKNRENDKQMDISTKNKVLNLEKNCQGINLPVGDREKFTRLTIVKDGKCIFEIKKEQSDNQENFKEWYVTKPYKTRQLVNVSDLYEFLEYFAVWSCLDRVDNVEFHASGLVVEEEFSDLGTKKIIVGQKDKNGNYYIKTDDSENIYSIDKERLEIMTKLNPQDFSIGFASLVYLTTIENLQIETKRISASFDIETFQNNSQVYRIKDRELEEEAFKDLYAKIISVRIAGEPEETTEKKGDPLLTVYFERNSSHLQNTVIRYFPYNRSYYLIEKDGQTEFLAEKKQVDQLIQDIEQYCKDN